jgi:CRP-like cAMP-binding protein
VIVRGLFYFYDVESFFKKVEEFVPLNKEAKEALSKMLCYHEVAKGHILVKPHTVCTRLYFVEKGLTRTYYKKDGKDITDWLSPEDNFAISILSFIQQLPDRRGIEALEDTVLWSLEYKAFEELCRGHHEIERMFRLIVSYGLTMVQQRFDDLHFATALERYEKLMRNNPTLLQRTPLGHIASYLGITQETLSRIRAQKFTPTNKPRQE